MKNRSFGIGSHLEDGSVKILSTADLDSRSYVWSDGLVLRAPRVNIYSSKKGKRGVWGCPPRLVLPRRGNCFSFHGSSLPKSALFCCQKTHPGIARILSPELRPAYLLTCRATNFVITNSGQFKFWAKFFCSFSALSGLRPDSGIQDPPHTLNCCQKVGQTLRPILDINFDNTGTTQKFHDNSEWKRGDFRRF